MGSRIISNIVKVYPTMFKVVIYHEDYVLPTGHSTKRSKKCSNNIADLIDRSVRRTKTTISDIIACNRFDLWCTFTFNCKNCDTGCKNWIHGNKCTCPRSRCKRFDPDVCKVRMSSWLHRQQQRNPHFQYLIVPEFHKNGALHFHAFIKDCDAKLIDTKKVTSNGHRVYKLLNFTMGINDVIDIRSQSDTQHDAIASYMQKYITKDMPRFHNRKRYFCSQSLVRPRSYVNGVALLGLRDKVQGFPPVYVDDTIELQIHPISDL